MIADHLAMLVVPLCFVLAGLLGLRLGTPPSLAAAVATVGLAHVAGVLLSSLAVESEGPGAAVSHLLSQVVFVGGFAALVWVARAYPQGQRPGRVELVAALAAVVGPLIGALSGRTPTVVQPENATTMRGPVVEVLPEWVSGLAAVPLMGLPVVAMVVFGMRFAGAAGEGRRMMRWPLAGVALVAVLVVAGATLGDRFPVAGTALFLVAAPVLPLSLALGPVRRRLLSLTHQTARLSENLAARVAELEESRRRLSVAADDERRRIERDLHDGAQQEILAVIVHAERARALPEGEQREKAIAQIGELARAAYETVRRVSHGIRPAVLDDLGLLGAVGAAGEAFPLPVTVTAEGLDGQRFRPAVEGAALFFVSEALANVLKHAEATAVTIQLAATGGLTVRIEDDGRGGVEPDGAGVRGICDRVEALDGEVTIDSRPGRTRLTAWFPGEAA